MNITYTGHGSYEKLISKQKFATTRFNLVRWSEWLHNRRFEYVRYLGGDKDQHFYNLNTPDGRSLGQMVLQDYLDNISSVVFPRYLDSDPVYENFRLPIDVPVGACPLVEAFWGTFRSGRPVTYLGRQYINKIHYKRFDELTDEDIRLDGFRSRDEFFNGLRDLNSVKLTERYGDPETGMKEHYWIQIFFVWAEGPIQVKIEGG